MIENDFAAVAEPTAATVGQFSGIPVHPGEDTSAKEEDDWWRQLENVLTTTDAVHFIQGRTPPPACAVGASRLIGVHCGCGASGWRCQPAQLAAVEHNRKVESAVVENKRRITVV